jgi:hypothetical protein
MIERPSIIITSLGRTGTTFFSSLFKEIIPDCDSFHEPDIVQYFGTKDRIGAFLQRVKDAGPYRMVFLKLIGKWSLIKLSDARLTGQADYLSAVKQLLQQRKNFINSKNGDVYVETNGGYYGLLDVLHGAYQNHRAIFLIRDARSWVLSTLKVKELYGKKGVRNALSHKWPSAQNFSNDPLRHSWNHSSRFVKLCWVWSKLNQYAIETVQKNPHAKLFKFEEVFLNYQKYEGLNNLVSFAAEVVPLKTKIGNTAGWLDSKINSSHEDESLWDSLPADDKRQFKIICGPLMEKFGYDL